MIEMLPLLALLPLSHLSLALPSPQSQSSSFFIILDTGVGARSRPITRWPTSLRSLTDHGKTSTILANLGPEWNDTSVHQPILAYGLAYSPSTSALFSATGSGIIRTSLDGSNAKTVAEGMGTVSCMTVAEKEAKIYFGTESDGLINKADFNGSNVELVRNVSQGLHYVGPSLALTNSYPSGIFVDEERGFLYWSATKTGNDGSIRRAPLQSTGDDQMQTLAAGVNKPGHIRIVGDSLYWAESGAIKYLDMALSKVPPPPPPPSNTTAPLVLPTGTLIAASQSDLFRETDWTGSAVTLNIQSFVVYRDDVEQTLWFVAQSADRTAFGKLVEVHWRGRGDGREPVFEVLNGDTTDVGVPVGLEYIR